MKFISRKYSNLRIILNPKHVKEVEGRRVHKGLLNLGKVDEKYPAGLSVQFEEFEYETDDKDIIKMLKEHTNYGYQFHALDENIAEPTKSAVAKENEVKILRKKVADTGEPEEEKKKA